MVSLFSVVLASICMVCTARDCHKKYEVLQHHSACRPQSPDVVSAGVSVADKQTIVQEHNDYRSKVNPPAADMLKMSWDDEVAMIAQVWAETCTFDHDESKYRLIPGRFSVGQNLGEGYTSWSTVIKAWFDEVADFTYNATTNDFHKVGHYTQMVWARSVKIGCGLAKCANKYFHVCNYAPAGNINGVKQPYTSAASSCARCPGHCDGQLCDCGANACENGGTLSLDTCKCACKHAGFQVGDTCKLDCRNLTEPYMCGTGSFDSAGCDKYPTSVPFDCPRTCNVCPYGGYTYKEDQSGGSGGGSGTGNGSGNEANSIQTDWRIHFPIILVLLHAYALYFI